MAWSIVVAAITIRVSKEEALCLLRQFVDDTFGASTFNHARATQGLVKKVTRGVIGPEAISSDKSKFSQSEIILGFQVDMVTVTLRPKDRAIDKIFYLFFSIDFSKPLPLETWQCVASIAQFYSPGMRGMKAYVAPFHAMTKQCGSGKNARRGASASALFAVEIWRATSILLSTDINALSVPLDSFLLGPMSPCDYEVISDASPWRLAAAVRDPLTQRILAWSTLKLPFKEGNEGKAQTQREYLGHLFSILLLVAFYRINATRPAPLSFRWINDITGALAWAQTHKRSSKASQHACMAVSILTMLTDIDIMDAVHIPGVDMGEIDAMSRMEIHPDITKVCPSLTPDLYMAVDNQAVMDLMILCDPANSYIAARDHHSALVDMHIFISHIISSKHERNLPTPLNIAQYL